MRLLGFLGGSGTSLMLLTLFERPLVKPLAISAAFSAMLLIVLLSFAAAPGAEAEGAERAVGLIGAAAAAAFALVNWGPIQ